MAGAGSPALAPARAWDAGPGVGGPCVLRSAGPCSAQRLPLELLGGADIFVVVPQGGGEGPRPPRSLCPTRSSEVTAMTSVSVQILAL